MKNEADEQTSTVDAPVNPDGTTLDKHVRWLLLSVLLAEVFMSLVGVSIVNVALPSIQHSLDASLASIQWVLSGYALTFGMVLVASGRLGDIAGRSGLFLIGVGIFTVSSLVSGLSPDAFWLNVSRFVQGVGSGIISPQVVGMIQQYFHRQERGKAFGYLGSTVGVSVAIGPVLGGFLIKIGGFYWGWRLTFLINVPVGLLVIFMGLKWFPRPLIRLPSKAADQSPKARAKRALDPMGSLILGLAVLAILFPFVESRDGLWMWSLVPAAGVLIYLWVKWERYYARRGLSPMVNLDIFKTSSFTNGSVIMTLYFLGMTSIWVVIALYLQNGLGKSALQAGAVGIPSALASSVAATWAGSHVIRLGRKVVIGGILIGLLGLLTSIAVVLLHGQGLISVWWLLLTLTFIGIAQGSVISPNQTLTLMDVPLEYAGSSGAIMQTGQRIGTSVGIAVITAALFSALEVTSWAWAFTLSFTLIALVLLASLWFAWRDFRQRHA